MRVERSFLAISVFIWAGYGVYCLSLPASLSLWHGVAAVEAHGSSELRAMYGGLQLAVGVLALQGLLLPKWRATALNAIAWFSAGLGLGRVLGMMLEGHWPGIAIGLSVFEWSNALISALLLKSLLDRDELSEQKRNG